MEPEDEFPSREPSSTFGAAYGLIPLVVPYEDSPLEARVLNTISAGLLSEGRSDMAEELGMTKAELARVLRALKTSGAIYIGPGGRYRLSFNTSNFPNIAAR